jgi:hypothetical protein
LYSYADKLKNIQSFYTDAKTPETKQLAIDLGVEWLKANNPGVLDSNGNEFKPGFYSDIISGDKTTKKFANDTLNKIRDTNATQYVNSVLNADGTLGAVQKAAEITKITQGTTAQPYNPTRLATAVNSIRSNAIVKPGTSVDTLKANYGGLKKADGTPLFSNVDFQEVADAKTLGAVTKFNNKLDSLADKVVNSTASTYVTADPVKTAAAKKALISDPTNFVTSVNALNKPTTTSTDTTTTKPAGGIASLRTWRAPQQGIVTANSPYSGLLDATLAKITGANFGTPTNNAVYKNLTDPLTQGMGVDSLPKPKVTYDATAKAGITGLGDISGTLQPLNTQVTSTPTYNSNQIANANTALENAADIAGKVVDPDIVKPPVKTAAELAAEKFAVDKASYMNSFSSGEYITPTTRNFLISSGQTSTDPKLAAQVDWSAKFEQTPDYKTAYRVTPAEIEKLKADKAAADKAAADKAAADKAAADKAAADKAAADKAAVRGNSFLEVDATNLGYQGDLTDIEAMQSFITPANQAARLAAEKAAAEKKVLADKAAAEQAGLVALANQQAADKAAKEKASVVPSVSADSNFTSINPNTYGPQQVTLDPNTVALSNSPSVIAANRATAANQATVVPYSTSVVPSVSAGNNFTGMSNNIGPQQVTLDPNTVVSSPSGINALSAQTVALPPSGPQPINPSNGGPTSATVGPITAAQRDLGPLNISNLGAVIGPQAMNSNAGGVASLVGPQVTVQPQSVAGAGTVLAPASTQTPQNPWDKMGISQQDYYENYW